MPSLSLGAKPSVLRCGRCGKFVDWAEARLQLVCGCRTHVELPPVSVRPLEPGDRQAVLDLFKRDFGTLRIFSFDTEHDVSDLPALIAVMKQGMAGALAYRLTEDALHMVALATDPMWQRAGVGGHLVVEAEAVAKREGRTRMIFATSNDNLPALYFYQRHGYRIAEVRPGALLAHSLGRAGFAGIDVRDEIRLEKVL